MRRWRADQVEGDEQKVYYFHMDQIGTPLDLTDGDGRIVWQATYRSWGSVEELIVSNIDRIYVFKASTLIVSLGFIIIPSVTMIP